MLAIYNLGGKKSPVVICGKAAEGRQYSKSGGMARKVRHGKDKMNQDIQKFLRRLDNSLLLVRGVYADWAKRYGVSYNGMAILYYMDGFGSCTQKQLSEEFLIPKQTVNNVVKKLFAAGYIRECPKDGQREGGWREKRLELTEEGKAHTDEMMGGLFHAEEVAARRIGRVQLTEMVDIMERYGSVLKEESGKCRMRRKAEEDRNSEVQA